MLDVKAFSLQLGQTTLQFPKLQGESRVGFRLPAQPPSRGFSGYLRSLPNPAEKTPGMRHRTGF